MDDNKCIFCCVAGTERSLMSESENLYTETDFREDMQRAENTREMALSGDINSQRKNRIDAVIQEYIQQYGKISPLARLCVLSELVWSGMCLDNVCNIIMEYVFNQFIINSIKRIPSRIEQKILDQKIENTTIHIILEYKGCSCKMRYSSKIYYMRDCVKEFDENSHKTAEYTWCCNNKPRDIWDNVLNKSPDPIILNAVNKRWINKYLWYGMYLPEANNNIQQQFTTYIQRVLKLSTYHEKMSRPNNDVEWLIKFGKHSFLGLAGLPLWEPCHLPLQSAPGLPANSTTQMNIDEEYC